MSELNIEGLNLADMDSEALEMKPLPQAIELGAKEICRIWAAPPQDEGEGVTALVQVRNLFENPTQWATALAAVAVTAARLMPSLTTDHDRNVVAGLILLRGAQRLDGFAEAFQNFKDHFLPAREQRDTFVHPGAIPVLPQVEDEPDARQLVAVWEVPHRFCDDCTDDHGPQVYFGGNLGNMAPTKYGRLLAKMAHAYAISLTTNSNERFGIESEILSGIIATLNEGSATRA